MSTRVPAKARTPVRGDGSSDCQRCDAGFTTRTIASADASACVCSVGSYLPIDSGVCESCPDGMVCAEGSNARQAPFTPKLKEGFWTDHYPFSVFRCYGNFGSYSREVVVHII